MKYIANLQKEDGSFAGDIWDEIDTRFSFCAIAVFCLLGRLDAVNVDKAVDYVVSCMNFDGGFGCRPGSASHSGFHSWTSSWIHSHSCTSSTFPQP